MALEKLAKIISFSLPIRDVDSLAHATFQNKKGITWTGDMLVERLYEKMKLRELVDTLNLEQIKLLESYLDALKKADEEDSIYD